jgi:hypothetical protein
MTTRVQKFLDAFRLTGQVSRAARLAEIDRGAHYKRIRKDPEYRKAFEEAEKEAAHALQDKAVDWAFDGVEEPVIYQGKLCFPPDAYDEETNKLKPGAKPLTRHRRDSSLAMFILRGLLPERYRRTEMAPPRPDDGKQTWEEFLAVYYRRFDPGADATARTYPPDKSADRKGQWSSDAAPPPVAE